MVAARSGKRHYKILVAFERRDDGGLRAYSDDVPGFVLSHSDARAVMRDVKPALETILSAMLDVDTAVEPLTLLRDPMSDEGAILGSEPNRFREYVAETFV